MAMKSSLLPVKPGTSTAQCVAASRPRCMTDRSDPRTGQRSTVAPVGRSTNGGVLTQRP